VVALVFVVMQIIRVNRPATENKEEIVSPIQYTPRGPLVNGNLTIEAGSFYSTRIELNHRAKLVGSFRTPNIRSRVGILVLREKDFENWNTAQSYQAIAETGHVPGGKINVGVDPGVYFLVVDNRQNSAEQPVWVDFSLD
jgi:hypothetical protein